MFRGGSRPRGDTPVAVPQQQEPTRGNSSWRPALRRIKKGLFSKPASPENLELVKPAGNYSAPTQPLLEIHQQRLNERNARPITAQYGQIRQDQDDFQNSNVLRKRLVPMGPREPKEPSTFNLVKRSLSRRNSKRNSTQEAREPIFVMRDIKKDEVEIISAGPPTTIPARYIPRHAAYDFQKQSSNQQKATAIPSRKPIPTSTPRKIAAYEPKHAASDFSKLKLPFDLDSNGLAQPTPPPATKIPSNPFRDIHHTSSKHPDAELDDYQRFMQASRLVAASSYNSHGVISGNNFTPKTSQLMQEIISNRQSMEKERAYALSQRSTASRPVSRSGSIFDRVADYVKPMRSGSVRSRGTGFTTLDVGSVRGGLDADADKEGGSFLVGRGVGKGMEERERSTSRWSRVGGSLRRSFSRDKDSYGYEGFDGEGDEVGFGDKRGRQRRSRIMPVSPGLKKYNQVVRHAGY